MYASAGPHPYVLPLGLLSDHTSCGPLWDPSLNSLTYTYTPKTGKLIPSTSTPKAPTSWFYFNGRWGDRWYPLSDPRQYGLLGEYHYVSGPLGPRFKNLDRKLVCAGEVVAEECAVRTEIESADEVRFFDKGFGRGEGEDGEEKGHRDGTGP